MAPRSSRTRASASAAARLVLPIAATAILFACSDAPPTAPAARAPDVPMIGAPPRATKGEEVTITHVTEVALTPRGLKGERSTTRSVKRLGGALRQGGADVAARPLPQPRVADIRDLPPAGLSIAAMPIALAGAGQRWVRTGPVKGEPGVTVESQGVGDKPAEVMRYRRNGTLLFTVRQEYARRGSRWALQHREAVSGDNRFREVVDAQWTGTPVEDGAAEATRHLLGQLGRVKAPSAHPATTLAAMVDDSDCCRDKVVAAEAAFEDYVFTTLAAAAVCTLTPPPADVLACTLAMLKVADAYNDLTRAVNARDACLLNPPKCHEEVIVGVTGSGGTTQDGGGWTDSSLTICWYEYWYDINTGEVFSWQLLYCERVA